MSQHMKVVNCLIIDDDQDDQYIFELASEEACPNSACYFAISCQVAVDMLIARAIPTPDFIFMDWHMHQFLAEDCLRELRLLPGLAECRIFILSGGETGLSEDDLSSLGIERALRKQGSIGQLSSKLAEVFNSSKAEI